jgi:hypothetical protein
LDSHGDQLEFHSGANAFAEAVDVPGREAAQDEELFTAQSDGDAAALRSSRAVRSAGAGSRRLAECPWESLICLGRQRADSAAMAESVARMRVLSGHARKFCGGVDAA